MKQWLNLSGQIGIKIDFIIKINSMSSPGKADYEIEHQIKKRINLDSPSRNDLDFYLRKVRRLENDNQLTQDQLSKLRIRLRRAEDYQLKYQLILVEGQNLKKELETKDKQIYQMKSDSEKLKAALSQHQGKDQSWNLQKRDLLQEIEKWTQKAENSQIRRVTQISQLKEQFQLNLKRELQIQKKDLEEKQDQYQFEIRQLKKIIHEKETVEAVIHNRVEKIRREKDQEIKRLGNVIQDEKQHRKAAVEEKNEQMDKLKQKFEKMINFQLQNLKKNLEDQGQIFSIQLNGLREIIGIKNDQISKLLEEIKRQATDHSQNRKQLLREIDLHRQKIYEVEKEGQLQLYNLKEKLIVLHSKDLKDLEERYQQIINKLRDDKEELEQYLKSKEKQREEEKKDHQRNLNELQDKIKERDQRITSLLDRIKQSGDLNTGELKDLHQSFHKIEVQKQALTSDYQNNINFMTQQIAKLTTSNEVKNTQIRKLQEELHDVKIKYQEQLKEIDVRNKKERKERDEERQKERIERQKLVENFAAFQRDFNNQKRRLQREREKQEREKNKLKFLVQELEKDVERLNKYIKQLDQNLKNEYKRSQMNILDGDGARRQLTSQLNKQKVEIQTLKSIEVDQIKRKFEIESTRIVQENQKLKSDLLNKSVALENLQAQFKRLDYKHRNVEKLNKQRLVDYQKKMATLQNEINLTQHLYQTFMEAKARKQE